MESPFRSVSAIRLENFMPFTDSGWIDLKEITLLFGMNSSGKTAIIRALRLMQQSLTATQQTGPLIYDTELGVDVGQYRTFIHKKEPERLLAFSFKVGREEKEVDQDFPLPDQIEDFYPIPSLGGRELESDFLVYRIVFKLLDPEAEKERVVLHEWSMSGSDEFEEAYNLFSVTRTDTEDLKSQAFVSQSPEGVSWILQSAFFEIDPRETNLWSNCRPNTRHGFLANIFYEGIYLSEEEIGYTSAEESSMRLIGEELDFKIEDYEGLQEGLQLKKDDSILTTSYQQVDPFSGTFIGGSTPPEQQLELVQNSDFRSVEDIAGWITDAIGDLLRTIVYIGPLRSPPDRYYHIAQPREGIIGNRGQHAAARFLARKEVDPNFVIRISKWLSVFEISIDIEPVTGGLPIYQIMVTDEKSGLTTNLQDVGFGVSQLFPILVEAAYTNDESESRVVIVEQPELHLHPHAHTQLADMFIAMSHHGTKFLIETHSEHLLLRLRRRAAETTSGDKFGDEAISSQDLAALFIYRQEVNTVIEQLVVDDLGEIDAFPEEIYNFFSDDLEEVLSISKAAFKATKIRESNSESRS